MEYMSIFEEILHSSLAIIADSQEETKRGTNA